MPILKSQIFKRGFTLIEMLVVISIIGILAVLISANLNSARARARDAERKSDLKSIETALRLYYNDYGAYPKATSGKIDGCGSAGTAACTWGLEWNVGNTVYMQTLPNDPLSSQDYQYKMGTSSDSPTAYSSTDSFTLVACLENLSDTSGVTTPSGFTCPNNEPAFVITE